MLAYLSLILHTIISMLNSTYGSKGTSCKWIHFQLDDDGGVDDGGTTDSCLSLNQLLLSHQHGSIIMITKNQTKSTVMWKIKSRILHNETSDCASSFYLCVCLADDANDDEDDGKRKILMNHDTRNTLLKKSWMLSVIASSCHSNSWQKIISSKTEIELNGNVRRKRFTWKNLVCIFTWNGKNIK